MNNILIGLKNFIKNKNTVTIIGVIAILGLLYFGYNSTIKSRTNPIRIPVAKVTIQPRTLITDDMITYISIPSVAVSKNVKRSSNAIVNMYTAVNTVIPAGSMFYSEAIVTADDLLDAGITQVPEGQRPYILPVTLLSTGYNSILPGSVIDVGMAALDETGTRVVGRLFEGVTVLAVKDASGQNVHENTSEQRVPAAIMFAVTEKDYLLLKRAEYLKSIGVELFPMLKGGTPESTGAKVDRHELVNIIDSNSKDYRDPDETTDNPNEDNPFAPSGNEQNPTGGE